ncbi:hypothetical protein DVH24_041908 [Malus domestica]|uniref:Uncharacterized protein n=1 Tax=Malus domestica TaxID=3750 RepID=A0A498IPE0_MALDO|nr:hypothetical protein DVH24_041908 [Malus domestica]
MLNFGVPMEPEASELPKGLMLGRDENIHIRITPLEMHTWKLEPEVSELPKGLVLGRDENIHIRITPLGDAPTTSQAQLHRSTILSVLGPDHAFMVLFLGTHTSWDCSRANPLNFGVPMEPEASELPKGLVLGRDVNIHIRITPLDDVGSYKPYDPLVLGWR